MTQQYEVKRVEAQALLSELKTFAFDRSPGFKQNTLSGYEEHKTFHHDDPIPSDLRPKFVPEICKSNFGFNAFRIGYTGNKRLFSFVLQASIERSVARLDEHQRLLVTEGVFEAYDGFDDIDEEDFTESSSVEFSLSGDNMREIEVNQTYDISYNGIPMYERSSEDVLCTTDGMLAAIDPDESNENSSKLYVPQPITVEQLPPADKVAANIGFWALVEPFQLEFEQGIGYRSAARQMRAITHALACGQVY